MFRNYIKVAIRNLLRQKGFAIINIFGLTIGLTVAALIILYIVHELGYDRFHKNSERIYRVAIDGEISGQLLNVAVSSPPFGPALMNDYPEINDFVRIDQAGASALFAMGDREHPAPSEGRAFRSQHDPRTDPLITALGRVGIDSQRLSVRLRRGAPFLRSILYRLLDLSDPVIFGGRGSRHVDRNSFSCDHANAKES